MKTAYKINPRNSTVNGSPGRRYDWTKFCWDGSAIHLETCSIPGHPVEERKALLPYTDGLPIAPGCQYLHVPYNWAEDCTVFRVRPNDVMCAGQVYRGRMVKRQTAELRPEGWYWVLEFEEETR